LFLLPPAHPLWQEQDRQPRSTKACPRQPTGISGLDEITLGGLPAGRPTWCAAPPAAARRCWRPSSSCTARTVRRARRLHDVRGEPEELTDNMRSLGFDLDKLASREDRARLRARRAQRDRGDRRVRPGGPVHPPGPRHRFHRRQARRARHDRALFAGLPNQAILRAELRRSSAGSRKRASPPSSPANAAKTRSRATAWKSTWPTA
jgi:circadian clock protein KaiC